MLKPILLVGAGRNGSTALMSLLGSAPEIEFDRTYPYERNFLTYFIKMASVIGESPQKGRDAGWNRQSMRSHQLLVGPIPFNTQQYLGPNFGHDLLKSLWVGFSEHLVAQRRAEGAAEPIFYAEKAMKMATEAQMDGIPEPLRIHLLRDPRDTLLSTRRFNEKRGTYHFGWTNSDTDLSYAKRKMPKLRMRLNELIEITSGASNRDMLLRYEDFVTQPDAAAVRLSKFLGVQLNCAKQLPLVAKHVTSSSAIASVDRWKEELEPEVSQLFASELGHELSSLGYEA